MSELLNDPLIAFAAAVVFALVAAVIASAAN